jgi:uroporphyrin-3 C-methyltransferase
MLRAAVATAGVLWWQYREFYVELSDTDRAQSESLQDARAVLRQLGDELTDSIEGLTSAQTDLRRRADAITDDIETVQPRIAALSRRIDALQGGNLDARAIWLRAEAEYYLITANTELVVADRWDNAIAALELADGILRQLANPALVPVRIVISDELTALRAVALPDRDGLAFSLASLAARVPELEPRGGPGANYEPEAADLEQIEPGLSRFWNGVKGAVVGIVRIERRDGPVETVLSESEIRLARRQLTLELQLARAALIQGDSTAFEGSLVAARSLLVADFAASDGDVQSARRLLRELEQVALNPLKPDISGSLNLLREIGTAD